MFKMNKNTLDNIHVIFFAIVTVGIFAFLYLFNSYVQNQNLQVSFAKEQLQIQKETYIKSLFAEYKNNIDSCRLEATTQKKDEQFIKENCIDVINKSLLGENLRSWSREDLLITK